MKEKVGNNTIIKAIKPFKFIVHGWIENSRRRWYGNITREFLTKGDFNIIQVDWEIPARTAYIYSAMNTKLVGTEKTISFRENHFNKKVIAISPRADDKFSSFHLTITGIVFFH